MLGVIFGDLAAGQSLLDPLTFRKRLVGADACLSEKGWLALAAADAFLFHMQEGRSAVKPSILKYYERADKGSVHFPAWFKHYLAYDGKNGFDWEDCTSVPHSCVSALIRQDLTNMIHGCINDSKVSYYSNRFIGSIVNALKSGKGKLETLRMEEHSMLLVWVKQWREKGECNGSDMPDNSLFALILGWVAFEKSYDFTTAIKYAASIGADADRHAVTMIAATFAEAYYRCDLRVKDFPKAIVDAHYEILKEMENFERVPAVRERVLASLSECSTN